MIDIHSHIIPNVDDGADSMESAMLLAGSAAAQGATAIFATPHSFAFSRHENEVLQKYDRLKALLHSRLPQLKLYLGCELLCTKENIQTVGQQLLAGVLPTMNGTDYVLAEFAERAEWDTVEACVSALLDRNRVPIIAHAERYPSLTGSMDAIRRLRELGCLIQLNVYSLESIQPEGPREWARRLVREKQVDFLGTDMHGYWVRMPSITQGMLWLTENCDPAYLDAITRKNAEEKLLVR